MATSSAARPVQRSEFSSRDEGEVEEFIRQMYIGNHTRFIAVNEFLWMADVATQLRAKLGPAASKVPTRVLPDFALRAMSVIDPSVRAITPMLGRKFVHTSAKAQRVLGWHPRSAGTTIVDCAESLIARDVV